MNHMRINARERFYLAADGDTDGTVDVSGEHAEGYATIEDALRAITADLEKHGGVAVVYECVPVKRVTACGVTVEDIKEIG